VGFATKDEQRMTGEASACALPHRKGRQHPPRAVAVLSSSSGWPDAERAALRPRARGCAPVRRWWRWYPLACRLRPPSGTPSASHPSPGVPGRCRGCTIQAQVCPFFEQMNVGDRPTQACTGGVKTRQGVASVRPPSAHLRGSDPCHGHADAGGKHSLRQGRGPTHDGRPISSAR